MREGELPLSPAELARRTRSSVLEFGEIFCKKADKMSPDKWYPPAPGVYKINVDGSFVLGQEHAGWGVAVRLADGSLVHARAGRQEHTADAYTAEVIAMSKAITTAADLGMLRMEFEMDSQLLSEALNLRRVDSSAYAAAIEDMKYQLKLWFSFFSI